MENEFTWNIIFDGPTATNPFLKLQGMRRGFDDSNIIDGECKVLVEDMDKEEENGNS